MSAEHYLHHDADTRALIAEAEVRGAVRALREAADARNVEGVGFRPGWGSGNEGDMGALDALGKSLAWLRARADRIEAAR